MELTVIGAGPAYTDRPGALGSAYLLSHGDAAILLDLGQGAFPALAARIEPSTLAAVVITHLHPDHFIDLIPLRHYLRYEFDPPRRLTVHAPAGLSDRIDALHGASGFFAASLDVVTLAPGTRRIGPFEIEAVRVTHTDDSHAVRVTADDGAGALVYSGDCGRAADLVPIVRSGDTLLTEVSFGPGPVPVPGLHLDGASIAELARKTRPGRILLTHLQMGYDPAETLASVAGGFEGPLTFVAPGDRLTI
jgi:ribonuclease BN (tRNA processing enzyme)